MMYEIIIGVLLIYTGVKLSLDFKQINYIRKTKVSDGELSSLGLSRDYLKKSNSYYIDKMYLSIVNFIFHFGVVIYFLFFNGIESIRPYVFSGDFINDELGLIILFFFIMSLIELPSSLIKNFIIEEKYGFNKITIKLFIRDMIISLILSIIIISIMFQAFLYLFINYQHQWWYLMWLVFILFNFSILYLYPSIISPLFNEFKRLKDNKILSVVNDLTNDVNFSIKDVYVMDGSRRSAHSNAYFTGVFKNRRIVFFDTLIEILTPNEIKAVLAHEIGHYKKKHITKSMIISFILSFMIFFLMFKISSMDIFFAAIGIDSITPASLIIVYMLILPIIMFFFKPLFSSLSRKNEYEADNYAKTYTDKEDLISSLLKLYMKNLSVLKTSPAYSRFYNSHPTVFERIKNLRA